ncbi:hypothetical protein Pelo_19907 [Pelomyxa schiedti]|nr:hypothetical protein Pelo_19907 [Pelomyxa schiedti]
MAMEGDLGEFGAREASLSAFALLMSEVVNYNKGKCTTADQFHQRLSDVGYNVGLRMIELASFSKEKPRLTRELTHEDILV